MQKTEMELIQLAKNGDDTAFEKILSNYKNLVTSICRRYFLVGGDVDDLLQEGMIGLYKAVKTYSQERGVTFPAYAKTVVERQVINAIKLASSNKNLPLSDYVALNNQGGIKSDDDEQTSAAYLIKSTIESPEKLVQNQESIKLLLKEIKKQLSTFEITVLEEYLQGYSYIQIAQNLHLSTKSIDNALNRIKNKLKFLKTN